MLQKLNSLNYFNFNITNEYLFILYKTNFKLVFFKITLNY